MPETIITKRCSSCNLCKTLDNFNKNRSTKDGYQRQCKSCRKISCKKYRKSVKGIKTIKEYCLTDEYQKNNKSYQKRYYESKKGRLVNQKRRIAWIKNHPKEKRAMNAINHAIEAGKILPARNHRCKLCKRQAQCYHHFRGYNKRHWFDVVPVCGRCHRLIHNGDHSLVVLIRQTVTSAGALV